MEVVVGVLFWGSAIGGILSVAVAVNRPEARRTAFLVAALLFFPIGILGILSIGWVFLTAAALCFVGALRTKPASGLSSN